MFDADQPAQAFLSARRQGRSLRAFPGPTPPTMAAAYAIQDQVIRDWDTPVAGWKIAGIRAEFRDAAEAVYLCGPIFRGTVLEPVGGGACSVDLFPGGFNAVEAELVFRICKTVGPDDDVSSDDLAALIGEIRLGVELAGNPLLGLSDLGPAAVVAGFGNNLGLIVGSPIAKEQLDGRGLRTRLNDEVVGETRLGGLEDRMPAFLALLGILSRRDIVLEEGSWVSTGALTGVHSIAQGDRFHIELDGFPAISGVAS